MKIINKEEFYKLPKGTLYSDFNPHCIEGLKIKDETISFRLDDNEEVMPHDYYYVNLIDSVDASSSDEYFDIIDLDVRKEFKMDYNWSDRDGHDYGYFVVYDQYDVENLVNTLIKVRDKTYE